MSAILEPPTAVLAITVDPAIEDRIRAAVDDIATDGQPDSASPPDGARVEGPRDDGARDDGARDDDTQGAGAANGGPRTDENAVGETFVAPGADEAGDVFQGVRDAIGCVVVGDDLADPVEACEAIRSLDETVPIVVLALSGSEDLATATTAAGASAYLGSNVGRGRLEEAIASAREACRRRRITAEESSMFATLVENVNTPIFAKDTAGRHLRMTEVPGGVDQDAVIGKTDLEVYGHDPEAAREFYEDDLAVVESGEPIYDNLEPSGPPGDRYWGETTKVPWYDDHGEPRGLVGISIDVTEQKQAERRLSSLEERFGSFASQLRHDLKSPLQVATGYLEVAQETGDATAFEKVDRALRRTEEIVDDMSKLAVDQGTIADETTPLDLTYEAREVWQFIATGDATLELETPRGTVVHANEEAIRPILENVLRNAVVHAGEDATIRLGTTDDGFYVADDGPGIPEEDRESALEEGFTTSESGHGTGLSIVADIAADRNWTVDVGESASGGARIEVGNLLVVPEPESNYEPADAVELTDAGPIGDLAIEGTASPDPTTGRWWVRAGKDVDREERDFYLVSATVDGPVRIEARIPEVTHVNDYSKGGLMVRDSNALQAPYGFIGRTVGRGTEQLWRTDSGGEVHRSHQNEERTYPWYRVERIDERVTCSVSTDGKYWVSLDQRVVALEDPVQIGLAACSIVPGDACEVTFADVDVRRLTNG